MLPRITSVLDAAALIATGQSDVVLMAAGGAGVYTDRTATAPWTRPAHEFVVGYGLFTAAEFALIARRHMLTYGTTPEQMAIVAATIRNNGSVNPKAVYFGRGPYTPEDILASRMVADPFHLLDCSTTSEGACGLVLARADRVAGPRIDSGVDPRRCRGLDGAVVPHRAPLGHAREQRPGHPQRLRRPACRPALLCHGRPPPVGRRRGGVLRPFSFEIIRQLEAFGFCGDGEGGPFVATATSPRGDRCRSPPTAA